MKMPRAPAGSTRSSSPSLPNSIRFWIGKLISLTWGSKVDAPAIKLRGFHMRSDIVPGAIFPDYELQGQHPMVLVLSRGAFCPKDRRQAEGLLELHREMEVGYCRLVTISTDNITETNEYRSGVGAHWPFLSDTRRIVQKRSRPRRIYGSGPQSDHAPCDCPRARPSWQSGLPRVT